MGWIAPRALQAVQFAGDPHQSGGDTCSSAHSPFQPAQHVTYHIKTVELELLIPTVDSHVMGKTLEIYIKQRIHQSITQGGWSQLTVRGILRRPPSATTASWEKRNRLFDFQRPTATEIDSTTIQLNCFPSKSYVQHYASVVATFPKHDGMGYQNRASHHTVGLRAPRLSSSLPTFHALVPLTLRLYLEKYPKSYHHSPQRTGQSRRVRSMTFSCGRNSGRAMRKRVASSGL